MDSYFWWWFIFYLIVSIESQNLFHNQNESTNEKQTSKKSFNNKRKSQSIFSNYLATRTSTIRSNNTIQSFVTVPNSYLYNPDEDDELLLERVKRDSPTFVCKGKKDFIPKHSFFHCYIF